MATDLAVVVLNYRTPDLALACLASLEGEMTPGVQVVVVDNASGDGSAEKISAGIEDKGWTAWARMVASPVNGGFAAGNNVGIRAIDAQAYVLLNSDTIVRPGALRSLVQAMNARPDAGLIGPSFEGRDGELQGSAFRAIHPLGQMIRAAGTSMVTRLLDRFGTTTPVGDTPADVDWVGFACVLIRRDVLDRVGLLDEGFFMYFEDADYCNSVRKAGYKVLFWPAARIVHLLGASSGVTGSEAARRRAPRYYYEARTRYFAKNYGGSGPWLANLSWALGRCVSLSREALGGRAATLRAKEALDNWTNILNPFRESSARHESPVQGDPHDAPPSRGQYNRNPRDIGFLELLVEDYKTHDGNLLAPGLWAVVLHRIGNARMDLRPRLVRAPVTIFHDTAFTVLHLFFGIHLSYVVKLGRRVRIWYHGGMQLGARSIGDDVHIRHNTTFGVLNKDEPHKKPIIGDRVDIGTGACILGGVTIGNDSVIGANSVVVRSFPPHSTIFGVPARPVNMAGERPVTNDPFPRVPANPKGAIP